MNPGVTEAALLARERQERTTALLVATLDRVDRENEAREAREQRTLKALGGAALAVWLTVGAVNLARTNEQRQNERPRDAPTESVTVVRADPIRAGPLTEAESRELDVLVDTLLITPQIPPGARFEDRVGEVPDERIREIMREIDETIGGRVEWPNVYVTDLSEENQLGRYLSIPTRGGVTTPTEENAGLEGKERLGIHLDRSLVDGTRTGCEYGTMLRHTIVHELQHAVSHDNWAAINTAADEAGEAYAWPERPTAESRADMAMLLYAELEQRKAAGGPRLNELTPSERSEVVREVLTQYVTPIDNPPQQLAEHRLREMLRVDQYAHDAEHHTWRDFSDPRTDRYIDGEVGYDAPDYPFVPTGMDRKARMEELRTPLPELAARWAEERRERPRTIEDWEARYYPEDGRPRQGPSPAVRVKVDAYERAYGYTPACVTFALEAIERHRERETAAARRGREEAHPEAWVPRGTAPGNADRLAGMDEATTGGRKPQDGFRVSYGAPPDVKAGWYLEKLDAAGATERIQGPGSVARIREELRSELGPGREDAVGRVLENGLDEHVREACRKFLEQSSPEHRAGLAEATARTSEARTALAASEREIVTLDVRDPYTILEWQPPDGVEMNHQKEGRGRHEVRFHTTRPVDIVVKVADKAVDELHVGLITSQPGSIRLDSDEKGNAVRRGDGAGDAVREGQGHGNAWHDGSGAGNAVRDGAGDGAAIRSGTGDGDARRTGRGNGDADRQGRGKGDAVVDSRGKGDAHVHEHAVGDATRDGRGAGNATVSGHATGNAARTGSGDGDATVRDHARGTATVSGSCPGNATNSSESTLR